jgi:putative SOS response-associated peptidase YedK
MDTGAILTTEASPDIADIHHRMPVVVRPEDFSRWLDCRTLEPRDVADILQQPEPGLFEAIPVSELVNNVANVGPEIQAPASHADLPGAGQARDKGPATDGDQLTLF